jgi:hypothetical protein
MGQLAITAKIDSLVGTSLKNNLASFIDMVSEGDLAGFEDRLWDFTKELYHKIAETVLEASAQAARPALVQRARTLRLGKLEEPPLDMEQGKSPADKPGLGSRENHRNGGLLPCLGIYPQNSGSIAPEIGKTLGKHPQRIQALAVGRQNRGYPRQMPALPGQAKPSAATWATWKKTRTKKCWKALPALARWR